MGSAPWKGCLGVVLIVLVLFPAAVGGASLHWLDDHMPYWLWADSWIGVMAYDFYETKSSDTDLGFFSETEDVDLWSVLQLDERQLEGDYRVWRSPEPITLLYYQWKRSEGTYKEFDHPFPSVPNLMVDHKSLTASNLAERSGDVPLCPDNTFLIIEHDRHQHKGSIGLTEPREVTGSIQEGVSLGNLRPLHDTVTIFDVISETEPLPEPYAILRAEVDRRGGPYRNIIGSGMPHDESNRQVYAWELEPVHRPEAWRDAYEAILREEREAWVQRWEAILTDYERGVYPGIFGRSAQTALAHHERWIEQLLDDADRILALLLHGQVPGFLKDMGRNVPHIGRVVVSGPADTAHLIHRHLWSYVPEMAAGSMTIMYHRLPLYLKKLYPTQQDLENVLIIG